MFTPKIASSRTSLLKFTTRIEPSILYVDVNKVTDAQVAVLYCSWSLQVVRGVICTIEFLLFICV